jgi:tetratricopeptide (TPR) repeat protein
MKHEILALSLLVSLAFSSYGQQASPINLAERAAAAATSSAGMGFEAESAQDGSLCTLWVCDATRGEGDVTLSYDLGDPTSVAGYTVALAEAGRAKGDENAQSYWVETAASAAGPWAGGFHVGDGDIPSASISELRYDQPKTLQFVRLRFPEPRSATAARVCVAEFSVWSSESAIESATTPAPAFRSVLEDSEAYQTALTLQESNYHHTEPAQEAFRAIIDAPTTGRTLRAHALLRLAECEQRGNIFYPDRLESHMVHLQRVIDEFPEESEAVALAFCKIGEAHTRAYRWQDAEAYLAHTVSHFPDDEAAYWARLWMIDLFAWQGFNDRARLAFEEIQDGFLSGRASSLQYGWALFKVGHLQEERNTGNMELTPRQIEFLDRAWEILKDIPELAEPAAACKYKVAMTYANQGKWEYARPHLEELYAQLPDLPGWSGHVLYKIAWIHFRQDDLNGAEALAKEVQERFPDIGDAVAARSLIEMIEEKRRYNAARIHQGAKQYPRESGLQ